LIVVFDVLGVGMDEVAGSSPRARIDCSGSDVGRPGIVSINNKR
jgi:hypothetical protein